MEKNNTEPVNNAATSKAAAKKNLKQQIENDKVEIAASEKKIAAKEEIDVAELEQALTEGFIQEAEYTEIPGTAPDTQTIQNAPPNDIPDPLDEPVIERAYTKPAGPEPGNTSFAEEVIPEPVNTGHSFTRPPVPPVGGDTSAGPTAPHPADDKKVNPNLEDLTPGQKRRGAEKAAEAILLGYGKIFPIPFKWLASFNMSKLRKLELQNKLQLNMRIMDDGTTLVQYVQGHNANAEALFVVSDEMKNELREPLIEFLMERNIAFTPTERLIAAVVGQAIQFGQGAIAMHMETKNALKQITSLYDEYKKMNGGHGPPPAGAPSQQTGNPVHDGPVGGEKKWEHHEPAATAGPTVQPVADAAQTAPAATKRRTRGPGKAKTEKITIDEVIENGQKGVTITEEPAETK